MDKNLSLVNTYYPIGYFANFALSTTSEPTGTTSIADFWASLEQPAGTTETLIFNLSNVRPVNFIDFEICQKPINILVEWSVDGISYSSVVPSTNYEDSLSIAYLDSSVNPWHYFELHFNLISAQYIRVTFTRRTDLFPTIETPPFNWSIEVRHARLMRLAIDSTDLYDVNGSFLADSGTDILGNGYRTTLTTFGSANAIDGNTSTYWQSQPNPSPFAVEALYFDVRASNTQVGYQSFLENLNQGVLDTRDQTDLENYHPNGQCIDEIYIDPITVGPSMHIYWSNDDTPIWDDKLWTPIPRNYILKKGYYYFPSPLLIKYLKLEFSRLVPIPYHTPEYPDLPQVTYRKYPQWVQDYFNGIYNIKPANTGLLHPIDTVQIDPTVFGFQRLPDTFDNQSTRVAPISIPDTSTEATRLISQILSVTPTEQQNQDYLESQIKFFSSFMYQQDLIQQLDNTRSLSRFVKINQSTLSPSEEFNSENAAPTTAPVYFQSSPDLTLAELEKRTPTMWFPITCRHSYQVLDVKRSQKIAYFVGIREIQFTRRDYSIQWDEPYFIETLGDQQNVLTNDFTPSTWRYIIGV